MSSICAGCGINSQTMPRCEACHATTYCSKSCQRRDWKRHKDQCTSMAFLYNFSNVYIKPSKKVKELLATCASIYCKLTSNNTIAVTVSEENGKGIFVVHSDRSSLSKLDEGQILIHIYYNNTRMELLCPMYINEEFTPYIPSDHSVTITYDSTARTCTLE